MSNKSPAILATVISGEPLPKLTQKTPFEAVKQSRVTELLCDLNAALVEMEAAERSLAVKLADVMPEDEGAHVAGGIAATGGIAARLEAIVKRVRDNTAIIAEMESRIEV